MAQTSLAIARRKAGAQKPTAMIPHKRSGNSKYKPEYCEVVEAWGRQGKSKMEIASLLNIDRKTIHEWEGTYPEFGQSVARAMTHSQAWWEGKAQKSLGRKHFQAQLWRYSVQGRFKEDYAEQRSDNVGGFDLGSFVGAIAQAGAKVALAAQDRQPGDGAKVINPLDDVVAVPNKDR